jgi:alpha-methylacyl-CoA racemase
MVMALEGVKILDLSHKAQGRFCTLLLGDLGADVISVTTPWAPSTIGVATTDTSQGEFLRIQSLYDAFDRNKRSIMLNLKSEQGRDVFYRLAKDVDVVVETFRPGVVDRMRIGYRDLKTVNPRIIYCSVTGYGQTGPYKDLPGHDLSFAAISGALGMIGEEGGPPILPLNFLGLFAGGGSQAAIGILAALIARGKTGLGQYIDIAMTDGILSLESMVAYDYLAHGIIYQRGKGAFSGVAPNSRVYECKDGKYISLACAEPAFWENLCRVLEKEEFASYSNLLDEEKCKHILSTLKAIFKTKTRDEWFLLLEDKDVCVSKVYNIDEVFTDPHFIDRQMIVEVKHPTKGKVKQVGTAIKLSDTPGKVRAPIPYPGQHTKEILREAGYRTEIIDELHRTGAIFYPSDIKSGKGKYIKLSARKE